MYATTRQFLDYFNLKTWTSCLRWRIFATWKPWNAELGFSDPVPGTEAVAEKGLTLVSGTGTAPEAGDPGRMTPNPTDDDEAEQDDETGFGCRRSRQRAE